MDEQEEKAFENALEWFADGELYQKATQAEWNLVYAAYEEAWQKGKEYALKATQ